MNGYQIFLIFFGLLSLACSGWAIWCVSKAPMRYKPAWVLGCLFGFVGFGLNWSRPEHLILLFGVAIPPAQVFTVLPAGPTIVKVLFPVVALAALGKSKLNQGDRYSD